MVEPVCNELGERHEEHTAVYGAPNDLHLTGSH